MEDIKAQLLDFGFSANRVERALRAAMGKGLQGALDWIEEHADDSGIDDPLSEPEHEEGETLTGTQYIVCNDCGVKFTSPAFAQLHATKTGHEDFAESTETIKPLTEDEKAAKLADLKEKLAEKRKMDVVKREEEEKQNELIRRKATKDTAEIKRQLEEKDAKKELEKRTREKQEEKALRERIKAQIEDDRQRMRERAEEEKRRAQGIVNEVEPVAPLVAEAPTLKSDTCRLQIRLPDGKALRETLPSGSTLSELLDTIETKSMFSRTTHTLMIALPPRTFGEADEGGKTLEELGLSPSSTLILRKGQ